MRTPTILVLTIASTVLLSVNCSRSNPGSVVISYLEASKRPDTDKAYELVSAEDRAFKTKEQLRQEAGDSPLAGVLADIAKRTSYRIKEERIQGNRADVVVAITAPDVSKAVGSVMAAAFAAAMGGEKSKAAADEQIAKTLKTADLPLVTTEETYRLVKEEGGWKVYFAWAKEEKLSQLKTKADGFIDDERFDDATKVLNEMTQVDPSSPKVTELAKVLEPKVRAYEEQKAYFPKIQITNAHLEKLSNPFMGEKEWITGEIKNGGDRTVKRMYVLVTLFDSAGKPCHEFKDLAVYTGGTMEPEPPLKPNYSRRLLATVEQAPSAWDGKTFKVEVLSLEFE